MSRTVPMTVDEAERIRRNASAGVLDLGLPGTADAVRLAERTCARAELWGPTPADRRHSGAVVALIVVGTLIITGVALSPFPPG